MNQPEHSPLGKASRYVDQYDASLLFPIARQPKRDEIGVTRTPVFFGADLWTVFELSWLNPRGKPQVALAHITVPCESTHIIESKSQQLKQLDLCRCRRRAGVPACRPECSRMAGRADDGFGGRAHAGAGIF